MATPRPTVRTLALTLGLSRATVSNALRGAGRISDATAKRVREAALAVGYQHNPLAGALMSEMRRSRGQTFRGVIATIDKDEPDRAPHGPFHRELLSGMEERAEELGYRLEHFVASRQGNTVRRVDAILTARGIRGILLLPSWHAPDWSGLDWSRYAGVYTDYIINQPALNCVTTDPYRSVMDTLLRLSALGYKKPGLFIEKNRDARTHYRFCAPFHSVAHHESLWELVPPLLVTERNREEFVEWFRRCKPDVVLSHFTDALDWMESCGARVPETHGFVSLNTLYKLRPCAALDLQPRLIGARGLDILTGLLQRHELGTPSWPTLTTVSALWVDGPTVREVAED